MKQFARVVDGHAVEVFDEFITLGDLQVALADRYHPMFIEQLVPYDATNAPPAPTAPAVPVPTNVSMRQARLALLAAGKLAAVNAAINSLPSPQKDAAQIEWDYAATVDRSSAVVQLLAAELALDDEALDDLFTDAAAR